MGCRILHDRTNDLACLYCSTTDHAFGPVFYPDQALDAEERAEAFLRWLASPECAWHAVYEKYPSFGDRAHDPRLLTDSGLRHAYSDWRAQEAAQYAREAIAELAKALNDD